MRQEKRPLPRPVLIFGAVSLLNELSAQMVAPLIPILLATVLAAGPVILGAVEGVADAVAAFLKLWSGRRADIRPEQRKVLVLLGYGLALASRPLMGIANHWWAVIVLRGTDRLGKGLRSAPRDALLADATALGERGRAYGFNRGMDYAGAMFGALIAAAVLAWWQVGIAQVILFSAIPGLVVLVLLMLLPTPAAPATSAASAGSRASTPVKRAPLEWQGLPAPLRGYLRLLVLFGFARASEAFIMLRGHDLGVPVVTLLLLWAWLAALQAVTALVGAPLTDRVAKQRLTVLNGCALALGYAALAWASDGWTLWIAVSAYGILSGIAEGVERSLVSELANPREKGTAFGWYYLITGLVAIPAGLAFGAVWKFFGASVAFGVTALIALLSAACLVVSLRASAR